MPITPSIVRSSCLWLIPAAVAVGLISGCRPDQQKQSPAPPSAQPASPQRIAEIREKYRQQNPGVIVGPVVDAMPQVQLVAVGDVPLDQFRRGDVVAFINLDEQPVDTGVVFDIQPHILAVKYDPPAANGRAPQVGDVMVHVPPPRNSAGDNSAATP
jgi:hypothetical protein